MQYFNNMLKMNEKIRGRLSKEVLPVLVAKEKFVGFIKRWNKGKLAIEYYNGKIREKDEGRRRTKFNWNIKSTHSSSLIK